MNELQKKLMRRRNLNGELNGSAGDAAPIEAQDPPPAAAPAIFEKKKELPKPSISSVASAKSGPSAASELQSKLARRRGLNGELIPSGEASATALQDSQSQSSATIPVHSAPAPESIPAIPKQVISRNVSFEAPPPVPDRTPAWLDEHEGDKTETASEPVMSTPAAISEHAPPLTAATAECNSAGHQSGAEDEINDHPEAAGAAAAATEVLHAAEEVVSAHTTADNATHVAVATATEAISALPLETHEATDAAEVAAAQPSEEPNELTKEIEPAPAEGSVPATQAEPHAVAVAEAPVLSLQEAAVDVSTVVVKFETSEPVAATTAPQEVKAASALPEQAEAPVTGAGEVTRRTSVKLSTALPVLSDPFPLTTQDAAGETAGAGAAPVFVPVTIPPTIPLSASQAAAVAEEPAAPIVVDVPKTAVVPDPLPTVASAPSADATLVKAAEVSPATSTPVVPKESSFSAPAAAKSEPSMVVPKSDSARASSTSPMRLPTVASAASGTAPAGDASPLQRVNTSTGVGGSMKSPMPATTSPLRRTSSLSGSQTVPAKRSSWYPGKYILEGPSSWSGKSKPMLKMNPDAARSHYASLMSSSARDFTDEDLAASASFRADKADALAPSGVSPKMSTSQQREDELRSAQLPDMVAAGTSDDIIDMVLQLSRENGQLKREVAHLKAELERQMAVVKALRSGESADGDVSLKVDATAAAVPAAMPASSTSPAASDASARDVKFAERDTSARSAEGAPAPLSKSRSSRRFGGRSYYSNYQQDDDGEEDLFGDGDNDNVAEKSANPKFAQFAIDELNSEAAEASGGEFGSARKARLNSFGSNAAGDAEADQNLDLLLKSVTGSGMKEKEKDRRSLDAQKYLVQSFRSTSTITPQETTQERKARSEQGQGDWQERFGSLGLISSDAKPEEDQLFSEERTGKTNANTSAEEAAAETMDYTEFLSKFLRTTELTNLTRDFIFSVVGPNGDATAPTGRKKLSYTFYGDYKLDLRCKHFFDDVSDQFLTWPEFRSESDERLICARDGVEQYVMQRIGEYAFRSTVDAEGDEALLKRMKLLAFVRPEMLDIKPDMYNETLLAIAADELRKINACKTAGDKVACVVKCSTVIFRSLSLSKAAAEANNPSGGDNTNISGADDFAPLLIWVVLRSHIPKLCSNVAYIQAYLNPARLMGKWGYCLISLCSAIEFVRYAEADQFIIDPKDYETKLLQAEKTLNGGF